jgi:hypothetical protein
MRQTSAPAASAVLARLSEVDVCQLDMVACASPHWNPGFRGGSPQDVAAIAENCVAKNAWASRSLHFSGKAAKLSQRLKSRLPAAGFAKAVADCRIVLKAVDVQQAGFDGREEPMFERNDVVFNGKFPNCCEPFEIAQVKFDRRGRDIVPGYCKTERLSAKRSGQYTAE